MSLIRSLENRFYGRIRSTQADLAGGGRSVAWDPEVLARHKYVLLTSFRRDDRAVGTPVWLGLEGAVVYVRTGASDGKVKRIRRRPSVLLAPCTARGAPVGPPMEGHARVLEPREHDRAEAALRSRYGLGRRLYRMVGRRREVAYLKIVAAQGGAESAAP